MKTETYDLTTPEGRAAFAASGGQRAVKRARVARPTLPRAEQAERTGLSTFLKAGWAYTWWPVKGYRLDHPDGRTSGWQPSEREACDEARRATQ